jgi:REP-associated tyrosine transposase
MPRQKRVSPDGFVQHVLNRGDHRETLFHKPGDFRAFLHAVAEAACRVPMRILAYCIMRNHFHLLLWPLRGDDLPYFMNVLMNLHIGRYLRHYPPESPGHIYQSRYTNVIVEPGAAVLRVAKYVEANALTAGLVKRAEDYPWSSASPCAREDDLPLLAEWPTPKPANWLTLLNLRTPAQELKRIQRGVARGTPYGSREWVARVAKQFDLGHTIRKRGRPTRAESELPIDDRFLTM